MAEILGTVSSAFAVAEVGVTVGSTLFKLRELWREVQDVPDKIQDLLAQIDIYGPLLADLDRQLQVCPLPGAIVGTPSLFDTSVERKASSYCKEALSDLQDLVEELRSNISSAQRRKRGIAKFKVLLKKDDLNKFQGRLERAFWLLQFAHTTQQSAKLDNLM